MQNLKTWPVTHVSDKKGFKWKAINRCCWGQITINMLERQKAFQICWWCQELLQAFSTELYKCQECSAATITWSLSNCYCKHICKSYIFFFANPTIFIPAIRKANKEKSYETCISLPFQRHGNVCLGILNGQEVGLGNLNLIGGNPGKSKTSCYTHPVQFPLIYSLLVQTFLCKIKWWFMITRSVRLDGLLQIATGFLSPEPFSCNCLPLL